MIKKPYKVSPARASSVTTLEKLLAYAAKYGRLPNWRDDEALSDFLSAWSEHIREITNGADARLVFGQAKGRGNKKPNIEMVVATEYLSIKATPRKRPMTRREIYDAVRKRIPAAINLSDTTIADYVKRNSSAIRRARIDASEFEVID